MWCWWCILLQAMQYDQQLASLQEQQAQLQAQQVG
jgi:hypothetical protein